MPWILRVQVVRQQTNPFPALHPYQVILHHDTCNAYPDEVVDKLRGVITSLGLVDALEIASEAWQRDQAVIVTCPKEIAELYQSRLRAAGLAITIGAS
ncbi:hypothetical protein KSF_106660 [Reticulibacter mediterranei]|uniref:Adaptor protein ClpS core domain-containing protein n=1 Tax=Reticulibacter mediterranei TaxID=2778369 RepID=A0A8J3IY46_9CHLR|nr:ATP-dependent Clp protease adaptor ClpS [Reticulibacter mediterranei]GHP00619.1 hypothetical protein KSF_106660 [Reticulibacter mediterranei]